MSTRLLLAGNWHWDIYEEALARGFESNGWAVVPFKFAGHLPNSFLGRMQTRAKIGPALKRLNDDLLEIFKRESPRAVFFQQPDLVLPGTLRRMKALRPRAALVLYHNDNPFAGWRNRIKWRHYLASIPMADITLVYRPGNVEDARRFGSRREAVLPPYYMSSRHRPTTTAPPDEQCSVIYIGHYEPDGRAELIDHLIRNDISVRLYGTGWDAPAKRYPWLSNKKIRPARGEEYSRLLTSAKIALVFLSQANRDVWTRRCFEIPACGTLMMAPRTPELEQLFADKRQAVYYDSKDDLLQKVQYYLAHHEERERIARAGWQRCTTDEHNEIGRAKQIIKLVET